MSRDRTGEVIADDDADDAVVVLLPVKHECREGWLGDEDAPQPCPHCRPHLIGRDPLARPRPVT